MDEDNKQTVVCHGAPIPVTPEKGRQHEEEDATPQVKLSEDQKKYFSLQMKQEQKPDGSKSAPWCLLKALHECETENGREMMSKSQLISNAEMHYGRPMEPAVQMENSITQGFGAWSSVKTLEKHQLVERNNGQQAMFHLTPQGKCFCDKLFNSSSATAAAAIARMPSNSSVGSPNANKNKRKTSDLPQQQQQGKKQASLHSFFQLKPSKASKTQLKSED